MKSRMTAVMLIALTGCPGASSDGDAGFETGPCIEGECFDGLECLSDLCVGPDSESGGDSSNPTGNPTSITNGTNPTAGSASDSNTGPDTASSTSGPDSNSSSNSDSNSASDSNSDSDSNSASDSNSTSDSNSDSDSDSDSTTTSGGDETTTGDGNTTTTTDEPFCGNGDVDPGEQCDGNNLQGFDCQGLGLGSGTLGCDPVMCTFDTSMCGATSTGTTG